MRAVQVKVGLSWGFVSLSVQEIHGHAYFNLL